MPNLAPDVDSAEAPVVLARTKHTLSRLSAEDILGGSLPDIDVPIAAGKRPSEPADHPEQSSSGPKKKKYAKEAWPGKRPGFIVGPSVA